MTQKSVPDTMQTYTAEQLLSPEYADLLQEVVLLISHSFTEDPGTKWLFPSYTRSQYITALPFYMRFVVKAALGAHASVTIIKGDSLSSGPDSEARKLSSSELEQIQLPLNSKIKALSILIPPHGNQIFSTPRNVLRAGFLSMLYHCGLTPIWKVLTEWAPAMEAMTARVYPDPAERHNHWHLLFLASHPYCQGQGLGKRLLNETQLVTKEAALRRTEKARIAPLYLEASTTNSRRLYSRVGFREVDSMTYGKISEGADLNVVDGQVLGARQFGMEWVPKM